MIRRLALATERWMDDESDLLTLGKSLLVFGVAFVVVCGVIAAPFLWYSAKADREVSAQCMAKGGGWAVVGSHQSTTYVMSGKVLVPITSTVRDYGCVEVKR